MERGGPPVSDTLGARTTGYWLYGTNAREVLAGLDEELAETVQSLDDELGQTFSALFPPDLREGPSYTVYQAGEAPVVEDAGSALSPLATSPVPTGEPMARVDIIDPRARDAEAFVDHQLSLQERVAEAQAIKTEFAQRQIERINMHGLAVVADVVRATEEMVSRSDLSPTMRAHLEEFAANVIDATKRQIHAASILGSKRIYDEIDRPLSPDAPPDLGSVVDRYLEQRNRGGGA